MTTLSLDENDDGRLLQGLLTEADIEAATGWKGRTLRRRENEGLPVIIIGQTRLYPKEKCRAWILAHVRERDTPRRGRPRKIAVSEAA